MTGNHPQLILDGVKTMTRRTYGLEVVNQFPNDWQFVRMEGNLAVFLLLKKHSGNIVPAQSRSREIRGEEPNLEFLFKCPYGQVGDRLWVRESFKYIDFNLLDMGELHPRVKVEYRTDGTQAWVQGDYKTQITIPDKWRPSIHMPRWASRILREITALRPERLQEITNDDAKAEGVIPMSCCLPEAYHYITPFKELWDPLNAKRGYSWESNPWDWVIGW